MTPQEINIAIAEIRGWTQVEGLEWPWLNPETKWSEPDVPDCYGDLNAIEDAVDWIRLKDGELAVDMFESKLVTIVKGIPFGKAWDATSDDYRDCIHASAPKRCEAFLRVHGKYRE